MLQRRRSLLFFLVAAAALSGGDVLAQAPRLERISETATGYTFEIQTEWPISLRGALDSAPNSVLALSSAAVLGYDQVAETVLLPAVTHPRVSVSSVDYDEVSLASGGLGEISAGDINEAFGGDAAEVIGVGVERRRPVGTLNVRLLQYDAERQVLRRVRSMRIRIDFGPTQAGDAMPQMPAVAQSVTRSVLADGTWFRLPIPRSGLYKIDRALLQALGATSASIDPQRVQVFTNGGAPLPALNSAPRPVDLIETPVWLRGGQGGSFGATDEIIFYAEGPQDWRPDRLQVAGDSVTEWRHFKNPFARESAVFVRIDGQTSRRLAAAPAATGTGSVRTDYVARIVRHDDLYMYERDGGGSGLDWLGVEVTSQRPQTVVLDTLVPGRIEGPVRYRIRAAARSNPNSTMQFTTAAGGLGNLSLSHVDLATTTGTLVSANSGTFAQALGGSGPVRVEMRIAGPANARGWIDFVEAFVPRRLQAVEGELRFATPPGETGQFRFVMSGFGSTPEVWDVTDLGLFSRVPVQAEGGSFVAEVVANDTGRPRELVAFLPSSGRIRALRPGTPVMRQNLRGVTEYPDYIIITHQDFRAAADQLAEYRRVNDGLQPLVVDIEQIYNEFSGGRVDMRAVRDYMKFLYDRAPTSNRIPRYLLLFGDGHYDFRGISPGAEGTNFVPTYQTQESFFADRSFTSDDYFGLLDDNEGVWTYTTQGAYSSERVDIGIGRLPVRTAEEAATVLAKIFSYEDPSTGGAWRTRFTFVADDQYPNPWDRDLHVQNAEAVVQVVENTRPAINIRKIYPISYPEVQTSQGRRRPDARRDILRSFEDGTLVWTYAGHGSPEILGDERFLTIEDVPLLRNIDRLPIFVTATCSFGRFDLVDRNSGAEALLLSPTGGSVALFTTVRIVFTSTSITTLNVGLNRALTERILTPGSDGRPQRLGDILRATKNTTAGLQNNNRKFVLLGDPAMRVGLPERDVAVTRINEMPITHEMPAGDLPSLQGLAMASVEGEVRGFGGAIDPTFNGEVELVVFDAARSIEIPPDVRLWLRDYEVRSEQIYRGRASVQNGRFSAEFIVPQDVSYSGERGRVSAYALSTTGAGETDGFGYSESLRISETSGPPLNDTEGPRIRLFLNDTTFVSGGLVEEEPLLIVDLFDDSGINATGAGVGHNLLLVINGNEADAIDIGEYYRGALDSYQRGEVRYRLPAMERGSHTLRVRAWDVANNPSTEEITFLVEPSIQLALRNVFNYPNPTAGRTAFTFEHNLPLGTPARVQLRIYTINGRPVRTLDGDETLPTGVLTGPLVQIPWDGHDEDMDRLATGIYLYRLRVEVDRPDGERQVSERIERLAIIR
ncbi:type IX secretion system sortase PorU [soil metagenome]